MTRLIAAEEKKILALLVGTKPLDISHFKELNNRKYSLKNLKYENQKINPDTYFAYSDCKLITFRTKQNEI